MGCGGSKSDVTIPQIVITPDFERKKFSREFPTNENTARHTNLNSTWNDRETPNPIKDGRESPILPPPAPPTSSKGEILGEMGDRFTHLDKYANKTGLRSAGTQSIDDFTTGMFDAYKPTPLTHLTHLPTIPEQGDPRYYDVGPTKGNPPRQYPHIPTHQDKSEMLEKLMKQQKAEERMRTMDKHRQQNNLHDKLAERMKKKKKINAMIQQTTANPGLDETMKPQLPVTKKEALCRDENISLFQDLETFAVTLDSNSTRLSFKELMNGLMVDQLTDLEKVRILFHWITSQDLNKIHFSSEISDDTPLGFLFAIKSDTKTYAALFQRLCRAAGLHCKQITGFLKGVGYLPDYKFGGREDPFRGSWNGVLVDGEWRLIDTHWGARHVTENDESTRWHTEYKYEEHYFLPDPDQLINSHFPDERDWQLLPQPCTIDQYQEMTKLWPLFFKLKLREHSHQHGVIGADGGHARVALEVPDVARADAKFKAELRRYDRSKDIHGTTLQQYLLHYSDGGLEVFDVFLPTPGNFLLKIFALSKKFSDENIFTNCCLYQINWDGSGGNSGPLTSGGNLGSLTSLVNPRSLTPPFPKTTSYYGPGPSMREFGIEAVSHLGPIVDCDITGEAKVVVRLPSSGEKSFSHDLHSVDSETPILNRTIHSIVWRDGFIQVVFRVRPPVCGNFALTMFVSSDGEKYSSFGHNLVRSMVGGAEPYPGIPNMRVGVMGSGGIEVGSTSADLRQVIEGFVEDPIDGDFVVTFDHSNPLGVLASVSHMSGSNDECATVLTTRCRTTIMVRPTQFLLQKMLILRIYAAGIEQTQNIPSVFTAVLKFTSTTPTPLHHSPTKVWGPAGPRFYQLGVKSVSYDNSTPLLPAILGFPHRIYAGGEDFVVELNLTRPLQVKSKLSPLGGDGELVAMTIVQSSDHDHMRAVARIPTTGWHMLVVYGATGESNQLLPLMYTLIESHGTSRCLNPFPTTMGVWASSCVRLFSPMSAYLRRNEKHNIKVRISKQNERSYNQVVMVSGGEEVVLSSSGDNVYEFTYHPSPVDVSMGVLVKPDPTSPSMSYVLQFVVC